MLLSPLFVILKSKVLTEFAEFSCGRRLLLFGFEDSPSKADSL